MAYNKTEIDKAFVRYARHKSEKVLGTLLLSCTSMIDVVLSRYSSEFSPHLEDLHQEIQIKLMKSLRNNARLGNYVQSPSSYLFFKIRLFARVASAQCRKVFDMGGPLTRIEEEILMLTEDEHLTVSQISTRLGISQRHVVAHYNDALRKRGAVQLGSGIMHTDKRHRQAQPSTEMMEERAAEMYSVDPLNQLLVKEIVQETLAECLLMIDNHSVYGADDKLREGIKIRVTEMFMQEFGGVLS